MALEFTDESALPSVPATFIGFDTNSSDSGRSYAGILLLSQIPVGPLWGGWTGNWLIRAEVYQIPDNVIPEYPFGTITALLTSLAALVLFKKKLLIKEGE